MRPARSGPREGDGNTTPLVPLLFDLADRLPELARLAPILAVAPLLVGALLLHAERAEARRVELDAPIPGEPPSFRIAPAMTGIHVDGLLDEPAWGSALVMDLPYEVMPGENIEAPVRTECRLLFDRENLYAAFIAHDPEPGSIRARISDRDNTWGDDAVGLMLDSFNDQRRAFSFMANPLGVQLDILRNDMASGDDDSEDPSWDAIWNSAGRITGDGYTVEMAIPFASLRFPRTEAEQTWGFNLFRDYPRGDRHQIALRPLDRSRNCMVCQYAKLTGLSGILPGRSVELDPTVTALRHDERAVTAAPGASTDAPSRRWRNGEPDAEFGLSARWSATPNLIVNGAVNPDFSQVEADAAQLEVNTRYALFYEERRPFFLEGADFFQTPFSAVHTRTVADPAWGVKLTGKEGPQAVGVILTRDEQNNLAFPSNAGTSFASFDEQVTGAILRFRRDVGHASTVGMLATARESDRYHNRVLGLDGDLRLGDTNRVTAQILGSATRYPADLAEKRGQPQGEFRDLGGTASYQHGDRDWSWWAGYEDVGADLRADAGFFPRVDTRSGHAGIQHTWWGSPEDWTKSWLVGIDGNTIHDHHGRETDRSLGLHSSLSGPRQLWLRSRYERRRELYAGRMFDIDFFTQRFSIRPGRAVELWGAVAYGDGIDYLNTRRADRHWGGPGASFTLGRHLTFWIDHTYERLAQGDQEIYFANLIQSRLVYQFTHRAFLRTVCQYTDVDYNPVAFTIPMPTAERDLFLQVLGSYKLNPQTVVYLGYSDHRGGITARKMRITNRTLFCKIGYAWLV